MYQHKIEKNAAVADMVRYMNEIKDRMLASLASYNVVVESIRFNTKLTRIDGRQVRVLNPDQYGRVGELQVRIPRDVAVIRYYNKARRETEWHDFADYTWHQRRDSRTFLPRPGSGELTLSIKLEESGELEVHLPKRKLRDMDVYIDIFRLKDHRFGMLHSDNNANLNAALTAFLNVYAGTFVRHNPNNRHGFGEHCGNCKYNYWIKRFEGGGADYFGEQEDYENKYSDQGIITNSQFGSMVPQQVCSVFRDYSDFEAIMELNEHLTEDRDYFYDERKDLRGEDYGYRRLGPNEVVIGGKLKRMWEVRRDGTADRCGECQFYHKQERKDDTRVALERAQLREKQGMKGDEKVYVSPYWSQTPEYDRMPVFTFGTNHTKDGDKSAWHLAFPGEVDEPYEFMVMGIGGIVVTGTSDVMGQCDPSFVPALEGFNQADADAARVCNEVYEFCRNFHAHNADELDALAVKLDAKPEGLSYRMNRRWDNAVAYLGRTILLHQGDLPEEDNYSEEDVEGDAE